MRKLFATVCVLGLLGSQPASACKCAQVPTAERYGEAKNVVLLAITETFEDRVPASYIGGGMVPGKLLILRVLKVWKGSLTPGDIVYGWTLAPGGACDYPHPQVGAHIILFSYESSPHEITRCSTADPKHLADVSSELDAILQTMSR